MRLLSYCFVFLIVFTSCKSSRTLIDTHRIAKKIAVRKVIRKYVSAKFDKKTVDAKFRINYNNEKINTGFSVRMKMEKDKAIWLKGTKFITVFKVKITPDSVSYYSPYKKDYFKGDFIILKKILGITVTFQQLQNILLGQAISNLKKEKQTMKIQDNSYVLSPENNTNLFSTFFYINPAHFKLDKQFIVSNQQKLTVSYPKYSIKDGVVFPDEIKINASENDKRTQIDMTVKSVVFDTKLTMPFHIPIGYKRLQF